MKGGRFLFQEPILWNSNLEPSDDRVFRAPKTIVYPRKTLRESAKTIQHSGKPANPRGNPPTLGGARESAKTSQPSGQPATSLIRCEKIREKSAKTSQPSGKPGQICEPAPTNGPAAPRGLPLGLGRFRQPNLLKTTRRDSGPQIAAFGAGFGQNLGAACRRQVLAGKTAKPHPAAPISGRPKP